MKHGHRFLIGTLLALGLATALTMVVVRGQGVLADGSIIYVDADAIGENDGTSWDDAYIDLQDALGEAEPGHQIWVAEGIYTPSVEYGGTGDRYRSFQMRNGVAIYGGFDPSVVDIAWEDRNWVLHETILSGDIGLEGVDFDNCHHVFYHPAETALDNSAILDGFTITGGNADGTSFPYSFPHSTGGGMHNTGSSPTLINCTFSNNSADEGVGRGGGMANFGSSPTLTNCVFEDNDGGHQGGGMVNSQSDPILISCVFQGNSAGGGGGIYNWDSSPMMSECSFESNSGGSGGGGMVNWDSSPTLIDCTFSNNSARAGGGVQNVVAASVTMTNCIFAGNSASNGGGMHNNNSSPDLTNCTFQDNLASSAGGGIYNFWSESPTLTNCTFSGNLAETGGGIHNYYSHPKLTNCILWGNEAPEGDEIYDENSTPTIGFCDIQGGYEGEGNIDANPLFMDPDNGDYHLSPGSPCIDAGTSDAPHLPEYDFEGDDRILDGDGDGTAVVDMGVDEAFWYPVYLPLVFKG